MRYKIAGLIAAVAVMIAAPAMACGGLFTGCSPCGQQYVSPCAQSYVAPAPVYAAGCNTCGGWAYERLPNPVHQYYYVNQGPTYTGPGNFAPYRTYEESALPVYRSWRHHHRHMHYGMMHHGHREHVLRRYY
jgi:hypothetical protein